MHSFMTNDAEHRHCVYTGPMLAQYLRQSRRRQIELARHGADGFALLEHQPDRAEDAVSR